MMILRTWIQDDRKSAAEFKALEGVFSTMAMDDATVEESTYGAGMQKELEGDEDEVAAVINLLD
ncbi:unnamed protein product [Linum tenue]|uniref:Uncharacterized protein n=1 Tax=Linum tenue TaxID=586396 RepID=A0AAV0KSR3_9ROSI|nr:unnamed protein product [Linum tenue]